MSGGKEGGDRVHEGVGTVGDREYQGVGEVGDRCGEGGRQTIIMRAWGRWQIRVHEVRVWGRWDIDMRVQVWGRWEIRVHEARVWGRWETEYMWVWGWRETV